MKYLAALPFSMLVCLTSAIPVSQYMPPPEQPVPKPLDPPTLQAGNWVELLRAAARVTEAGHSYLESSSPSTPESDSQQSPDDVEESDRSEELSWEERQAVLAAIESRLAHMASHHDASPASSLPPTKLHAEPLTASSEEEHRPKPKLYGMLQHHQTPSRPTFDFVPLAFIGFFLGVLLTVEMYASFRARRAASTRSPGTKQADQKLV